MAFGSLLQITIFIYLGYFIYISDCITIQGYYWREFAGEIPSDAFPGGRDQNGNPIYIGQILHDNQLITTKIYHNDPKGYYGLWGKEHSATNNNKILCTHYPENFVWVQTKHDEIHLLTNREIVLGGFEPGYTMYIGRIFYKSETTVGKVSTGKTNNLGLFVTYNGNEINMKSFEILTYNSSISNLATDILTNNVLK